MVANYMKYNEGVPILARRLLDIQYLQENVVYEINNLTKNKRLGKYKKIE